MRRNKANNEPEPNSLFFIIYFLWNIDVSTFLVRHPVHGTLLVQKTGFG
jgi:hypothetical protein